MKLVAECYNTMFTSGGIPASKDTAPQLLVEVLDLARMKSDYGLFGVAPEPTVSQIVAALTQALG